MQQLSINNCDILVSFDASSLFTNVPLEETIQLLTDIAFTNNWFNETYQLHLSRQALLIFSEQQLKINFSFSMAGCMNTVSLWDPHLVLYSLTCLCVALKKGLEKGGKMLAYYRRSVDDTPTVMPNKTSAENLLETLNQCHSSVMFTMENESNGYFPSWAPSSSTDLHVLETKVFVKPRNTGLLLHYKSHVDVRYKPELPKTMLDHAFRLSSNWLSFFEECDRLKLPFFALKYSDMQTHSIYYLTLYCHKRFWSTCFITAAVSDSSDPVRVILQFKDQSSADIVRRQLQDLSYKIYTTVSPVFVSQKIEGDLNMPQAKPPLVKQCQAATPCLQIWMWPVRRRLCWLHILPLTPANWGTQKRKFIHRPALSCRTFFRN